MIKTRKFLTATLAGLAIASASPASAQWGYDGGWGYGGYGYGGCGWGGCYNNTGAVVGAAVAGMAVGAIAAGVAAQSRNNVYYAQPQYSAPPQKRSRSRTGGTCYQQQWDSAEGWVNVAIPCR
jgi:hypothetical protein